MNIHIVGLGYTGQTLAAVMAEVGFKVYGTDMSDKVLAPLRKGDSHIMEEGITGHVKKHIDRNLFVGKPGEHNDKEIDAHIVCVHTPIDDASKKTNLEAVRSAFTEIAGNLKRGQTVILRSTVPVGTTRNFVKPILEKNGLKAGEDFYLVFAPERTSQGAALKELRTLPQVIGGINDKSVDEAVKIFRKITPTIMSVSSLEAAELIKLIDNSYRDLTFAYAQEIANYCKKIGVNAFEVIKAANQNYPRNNIPVPSPGVGGVCLTKDPHILMNSAKEVDEDLRLIRTAREINESTPRKIADELKMAVDLKGKKVFVVGMAFKGHPETNDTRGSPAIEFVRGISNEGCEIFGYDPVVEEWKIREAGVSHVKEIGDGAEGADVVVFMTNHQSFKNLGHEFFSKMKKDGLVYDGWGLFNKKDIEDIGLNYKGVGIG